MQFIVQGVTFLIDKEDLKLIKNIKWTYNKTSGYAQAFLGGRTVYMHRLIMNAGEGQQVDHKNGNRQDMRKNNLRLCTLAENARNKPPHRDNKSGFKGVVFNKRANKWAAQITVNRNTKHLGNFKTAREAAQAYNVAAKLLHGEFAYLNVV